MDGTLVLVGASVRAAAASARRAGVRRLFAIDLFADTDLQHVCPVRRLPIADYPGAILPSLHDSPPGPVLYTGGIENHPRLVAAITHVRPVLGNAAAVLRRVRDPFAVARVLSAAGLPHPCVSRASPIGAGRRWLIKRRRGAGGMGIRLWQEQTVARGHYLQEFIEGDSLAAIYCGLADGRAISLGLTRQLVGETWTGAAPFQYCGSVGPIETSSRLQAALDNLGGTLTRSFGLRGLFGVDLVVRDDDPYPVEINPRYTASIEVLERATGLRSIHWHLAAFEPFGTPSPLKAPASGVKGKAIVFARAEGRFPSRGPWSTSTSCVNGDPAFADIPQPGASLERGDPILTTFAEAASMNECVARLRARAAEVFQCLE